MEFDNNAFSYENLITEPKSATYYRLKYHTDGISCGRFFGIKAVYFAFLAGIFFSSTEKNR